MFKEIPEADQIKQNQDDCEGEFTSLQSGDTVILTAKGSDGTFVKAEFNVTSAQHDTTESDDIVLGTVSGQSAKLRLPWNPAEPNVGIPTAYSEGPIQLKYLDKSYDVSSIQED